MEKEIIISLVSFALNIPVWGVLLFFLYRTIRNRDSFEAEVKIMITKLDKSIAVMGKDIENAVALSKAVSDMSERIGKLTLDVNTAFNRIRSLEAQE